MLDDAVPPRKSPQTGRTGDGASGKLESDRVKLELSTIVDPVEAFTTRNAYVPGDSERPAKVTVPDVCALERFVAYPPTAWSVVLLIINTFDPVGILVYIPET